MDESAGGRVMSDTTCIFILDAYQVYLNTADLPFVKATWPHLVRAAQWQINRTIEGDGFPHHLQVLQILAYCTVVIGRSAGC